MEISNKTCTFADDMELTFEETYLKELFTEGRCKSKKHRFQPQIIRGYQKALKFLMAADKPENLYPIKSLHFEALQGDKEGTFSVKANDQYRVEFTIIQEGEPVITICNIQKLSNHYK